VAESDNFDKTLIILPGAGVGNIQPAPRARLVCGDAALSGNPMIAEIALDAREVTVGRGDENTVPIKAEGISRVHARIFPGDGVWGIEDLKSTNGIKVNNTKITQTWLKPGDHILIGMVPYRYEPLGEAAQAPELDLDLSAGGERTMVMRPADRAAATAKPQPRPASSTPPRRPAASKGDDGPGAARWLLVAGVAIIAIAVVFAFL
jgi:hypothetical protein